MSDEPLGLPPGWPTDEHRSRVAVRARALRNRRLAWRTTALTLAAAVLVGGFAVLRGRSDSNVRVATATSTTTTTHRPAPSEIATVAEPNGWRIVDYGDARLAAPPGWTVAGLPQGSSGCPPDKRVGAFIYRAYQTTCTSVLVEPIYPGPLPPRPARTIHGFKLYLVTDDVLLVSYSVPELGVTLTIHGVDTAQSVLDTLTSSSRRVALGPGGAPAVPRDWRAVTYGGITLQVPPTWPIARLGSNTVAPGACFAQTFLNPEVYLGNGSNPSIVKCFVLPLGRIMMPTDGVWISAPTPQRPHSYATSLVVNGLRLWVDTSTDPRLTIQPQRGDTELPALIQIGLGPDPSVARTILYSIRATDRSG
jgi:hypothetical protein